ncbi:RloB family protein [Vibrio litoralis]|uniref:RloB family protein n=1 Tax=Vibrio litoralis TaxID=335972 RepID=UPI0004109D39|nr:RloB family protein [Vibrio litoralis]
MARQPKGSKRTSNKKDPYDKILIVSEGSKTEPNYFNEIKNLYEISSLNIIIDGDCGSSPICVVNHAKALAKKEEKLGSPFDKVFCVIDKDNHTCYFEALDKIKAQKGDVFKSVQSIPCFEYWLLLHFEYTTRAYVSQTGNSVGTQVIRDLKNKPGMGSYEKGEKGIFIKLLDKLETAKINATNAQNSAEKNECDNPSTQIHTLVEYLQNIKNNH